MPPMLEAVSTVNQPSKCNHMRCGAAVPQSQLAVSTVNQPSKCNHPEVPWQIGDAHVLSRPSTSRASAITRDCVGRIGRFAIVSTVNQPSKCNHMVAGRGRLVPARGPMSRPSTSRASAITVDLPFLRGTVERDDDAAGFDAADLPGRVAELEDVAGG